MEESERLSARSDGPSSHITDSSVVVSSLLPQLRDGAHGQPPGEVRSKATRPATFYSIAHVPIGR
jgi:hypothetical protein